MLPDSTTIIFFVLLGIGFVASAFLVSWLIRPRVPSVEKNAPYECGEVIQGNSRVQFNIRFYLVALIFVIFDVEILFTVPWALVFRQMGMTAFIEMLIFILVLTIGLAYVWKKGALEWQ
jgi:NADH-quinone oxidoreductase subunit A